MFLKSDHKIVIFLLFCFFVGAATPAFAFDLSGNWSYRQTGGDDQETQSVLQQNYQLGVGPSLSLQPTSAITVGGGVGYRNTKRNSGQGTRFNTVEQVTPYLQMSLINDIFISSISANTFITLAGSETSSSYWNAQLTSAWSDEPLWPNILFNYGEDFRSVQSSSLFDSSGGKGQNTSVTVKWDLLLADLYYEYNLAEQINSAGETQNQSTSNYVWLKTNGDFWENRIGYNLEQKFRQIMAESASGDEIDLVADLSSVTGQTFFASDAGVNVDVNIPLSQASVLNNSLYEETGPVTLSVNTRGYFGFRSDFTEQVATISLYLNPDSQIPNATQLNQLQWTLYRKIPNSIGDEWVEVSVPGGLQPDFDVVTVRTSLETLEVWRFNFNVNLSDQEFMVVLNNPVAGIPLRFSELDVFRSFAGGGANNTSVTTSYKTKFGLSYRISQTLGSSFNASYEHREAESGGEIVSDNDKLNWSGRLSWSPSLYFSPSIGYSEFLEIRAGEKDYRTTSYSLSTFSRLLPSLSVALGVTHNEQSLDYEKQEISNVFSLSSQIRIYPDLTASISSSYSDRDRLFSDIANDRTYFVNTKAISNQLNITARLTRKLVTYVATNYSETEIASGETLTSADTTVRLSYRPSDILSLQSSYSLFFGDTERTNTLNSSIDLYLLRTYKTRLSLSATHALADESLYGLRVLGSWEVSDYFSLSSTGNYSMGPVNSYSLYVNLAMRL